MEIKAYNKSFKYKEINLLKPIIIVVVLIFILTIIIFKKDRFTIYYRNNMFYLENKFVTFVELKDLPSFTKNEELLIENDIYIYEIVEISKETRQDFDKLYKEVKFDIKDTKELLKKENNYYNYNIILKKESFISYIFRVIMEE